MAMFRRRKFWPLRLQRVRARILVASAPLAGFPVVLSLPTYVPGSITATGVTGRVTATEA